MRLIKGWRRLQGLVFRPGDKRFEGRSIEAAVAAALADRPCLMVNRNQGAGTRVLIDQLLGGAQPAGYWNQPRAHNAVAAGRGADAGRLGRGDRRGRRAAAVYSFRWRKKITISRCCAQPRAAGGARVFGCVAFGGEPLRHCRLAGFRPA